METRRLKEITKRRIVNDNTTKISVADKFVLFFLLVFIFTMVFKAIELSIFDIPAEVYLANKWNFLQKWIILGTLASSVMTTMYAIINDFGKVRAKTIILSGDFDILKLKVESIQKDVDFHKSRNHVVKFNDYGISIKVPDMHISKYNIGDEFYIPVRLNDEEAIVTYKEYSVKEYKLAVYEDVKLDKNTTKISGEDIA